MRCRLTVKVENHSWLPVELSSLRLPLMGPGGGPAVEVREFDGRSPRASQEDDVDAVFGMHSRLAGGEAREFAIVFTFRPDGCTAQGLMWVAGMPQVEVTSLGRSGAQSTDEVIGFRGTDETDNCGP
jgi:hypothetical protein